MYKKIKPEKYEVCLKYMGGSIVMVMSYGFWWGETAGKSVDSSDHKLALFF